MEHVPPASANVRTPDFTSRSEVAQSAVGANIEPPGYYGLPMLKAPVWRWPIATYFLFEGISAGAFVLGVAAQLAGNNRDREVVAAARYVALGALVPCPPLLIADLGRPERFHHMLRVFKPSSPMNTGAWALGAYSVPVGLLALKQWTSGGPTRGATLERAGRLLPAAPIALGGIPLALVMLSYPGVLLSTTSTPAWAQNRALGAVIACSSISAGAAALSLALALKPRSGRALGPLSRIENLATAAEAVALGAYFVSAGRGAKPLIGGGRCARIFWGGAVAAGLVGGTLVRALTSRRGRHSRIGAASSAALAIAGSWALKWSMVYAGRSSARDPLAAQHATRPRGDTQGWVPARD